jgi:orotidine-5'-phosphate decarboxylase
MPAARAQDRKPLDYLAIALDTPDWPTFESWCEQFGPRVGVLKVGLEAFVSWGHQAIEVARRHAGRVFLDLKLHDIPHTVRGAVGSARAAGVDLLTVHAAGGRSMLEAACEAADDQLAILAVTVLTHLDAPALRALDLPGSSLQRAQRWAALAQAAGCAGAVCSALEVVALRERCPRPFFLATPGIRLADRGEGWDDQRRVATPRQALRGGADLLVVGRPVTRASDPERVLEEISREIEAALAMD